MKKTIFLIASLAMSSIYFVLFFMVSVNLQAAVVYNGDPDDYRVTGWDVDNNGILDFEFEVINGICIPDDGLGCTPQQGEWRWQGLGNNRFVGLDGPSGYRGILPPEEAVGFIVSENLPNGFIYEPSLTVFTFGALADFPQGLQLAGFKFDINGNTHVGWLELFVSPFSIEFTSYAYEDIAGHSIIVGAASSSSIPIPASLWLFTSAMLGFVSLQKSRIDNSD